MVGHVASMDGNVTPAACLTDSRRTVGQLADQLLMSLLSYETATHLPIYLVRLLRFNAPSGTGLSTRRARSSVDRGDSRGHDSLKINRRGSPYVLNAKSILLLLCLVKIKWYFFWLTVYIATY